VLRLADGLGPGYSIWLAYYTYYRPIAFLNAGQPAERRSPSPFVYQQSTFISQFNFTRDGIHSLGFGDVCEEKKGEVLTSAFSFAPVRLSILVLIVILR
jgi:hypothetical protein